MVSSSIERICAQALTRAELNTPHERPPPALRPHALLQALSTVPRVRRLLGTREQQDAHELFVILAEAVSDEAIKVAAEIARVKGLGDVLDLQAYATSKSSAASVDGSVSPATPISHAAAFGQISAQRKKIRGLVQPWEGLLARRRVCNRCGHSEAVRLETIGGLELSLPQTVRTGSPR